jgi:hypothetical protein
MPGLSTKCVFFHLARPWVVVYYPPLLPQCVTPGAMDLMNGDSSTQEPHATSNSGSYIFISSGQTQKDYARIDFRKREVLVEEMIIGSSYSKDSTQEAEELSAEALQTSKESFIRSIQTVVDQEEFDGFTLEDMHLLLRNLRLSDNELSSDFSLSFEEVDPAENDNPRRFFPRT